MGAAVILFGYGAILLIVTIVALIVAMRRIARRGMVWHFRDR